MDFCFSFTKPCRSPNTNINVEVGSSVRYDTRLAGFEVKSAGLHNEHSEGTAYLPSKAADDKSVWALPNSASGCSSLTS